MESRALHNISKLLEVLKLSGSEPKELNEVLLHVVQTARTFFAGDNAFILATSTITSKFLESTFILPAVEETGNDSNKETRMSGNGVTSLHRVAEQVLQDGILIIPDIERSPGHNNIFAYWEKDVRSFVALPLMMKYRPRALGILFILSRESEHFTEANNEIFQIFTNEASYILQEMWLLRRYQEVANIGQEINQDISTANVLFERLQKRMGSILDTTYTFLLGIHQPQSDTQELYLEDEGQIIHRINSPIEGASRYVMQTQQTLFIREMSKEVERLPYKRALIDTGHFEKEAIIFLPLVFREVSLGVISLQHPQPNAYDQEDMFILQLLANHIALAIHNMRLYNNLSNLSKTGQLLTQQLESEQVLQATVDKIQEVTEADSVVLYPYEAISQRFMGGPRIAGIVRASSRASMFPSQPDDIAILTLNHSKPIFAKESSMLYSDLGLASEMREGKFQEREEIRSTAALPLRVGDVSVGVLFVNFRQQQRFDASQKLLIEGLAYYAAIAIRNAQAYETIIQRRLRELEILQNIDRQLNRNLDLKSVLHALLTLANEQVHAEGALLWLQNKRSGTLEPVAAIGIHDAIAQAQAIPIQGTKGITRWVLEQKKAVRVGNVHKDPQWRDIYIQTAAQSVSELDVPLLDGEEVIGVLNFESIREAAFRQEDEDLLITLAGQAVLAIKNAQAFEREKRLAEEGKVFNEISKEIIEQLDTSQIFDLILEKALDLTHSSVGVLMLYDPERNDLEMAAERGVAEERKGIRLRLEEGVIGNVAREKRLLNIDLTQPPWNEIYLDYIPHTRSELAVPMLAGNELRGVLNVESTSSGTFHENDEHLLRSLADLAVVALQHIRSYERERRFAAEGQVLNEISKEIIDQISPYRVFDFILGKALELTSSATGTLEIYHPEVDELEMVAERGVAQGRKAQSLSLNEGVVGYVGRTKQTINVDPSQPPWHEIYLDYIPGTRSELAVPMLAGDMLRGVLNIESPLPNKFTQSDIRLMQALADLAVVALQNAERYEKAEQSAQRFELLYQAGQELSKITLWKQLEQAYKIILEIAEQQSQSQVVIRRYNEESQELELIFASQHQKSPLFSHMSLNEGLNGQVAREQRTIVVPDVAHPPAEVTVKLSDASTRALVVIPIKFEKRYYGNLAFGHEETGYFDNTDINFYEGLTQQLAATIYRLEIAQARQSLERRAISEEEMSSIGQSAFEITHRLGNDLGLVESYVGDIEDELDSLKVKSSFISRKLRSIAKAVRTVLNLSGNLKEELARFGATEEAAGEPVIIDPSIIFEDARRQLNIPENVQLFLDTDPDIASVRIKRSLVADILRNLITNAIEAMPAGGTITLRARNLGRSVTLEVIDTGTGIPKKKQDQIFDLFYSTKGSSGFGLWSARRYALRNHGDLKVESQPGKGTTFTLSLPQAEHDHEGIV
jgi:GAF domain-containing protein/anti-sigma regulatory factor (Ser/Thr protein kinase)